MKKILFVCHGNICRSPMAEFVMKHLLEQENVADEYVVESAATSTEEIGNAVYPPAQRKLAEHGISCKGKRARQMTRQDYQDYDLLIGMDEWNIRNMTRISGGDPEGKIHKLLEFTARPGDVADPWYTGNFEATWRDVLEGCQGLLHGFLTVLLLMIFTVVSAIPVKPGQWKLLKLDDGTEVRAQLVGDEHGHFWQAADGRTFVRSGEKGVYKAADAAALVQRAKARRQQANARRSLRLPNRVGEVGNYTGTKKGIILLVNFNDTKFDAAHDQTLFQRIANEENFSEGNFQGSVADYFKAQSLGAFELDFDVVGPLTVSKNASYYGSNNSQGDDLYAGEMVCEAVELAKNYVSDWSPYDWDDDGYVDQVYVVYAGNGAADGGAEETIWPHAYDLYSAHYFGDGSGPVLVGNGLYVNTYACGPELNGAGDIEGIGTMCHEFSHCLGYPDFYDTDYSSGRGMSYWDLMDQGSYNGDGYQPAGYTSYERWVAGWLDPIVLGDEDLTVDAMKSLQDGGDAYIIYNPDNTDEYFLLENRQLTGWDASLPAAGLLILHVDYDAMAWAYNQPNDDPDHQRMTWVAADNQYQTWRNYVTWAGLMTDPYPSGGNDRFNQYSSPAALFYNGGATMSTPMTASVEAITQNTDGTIAFSYVAGEASSNPDAEGVLFYESFNQCSGKGGNDGYWSGITTTQDVVADNAGWSSRSSKMFAADRCARFGTGNVTGMAVSPAFILSGTATLTFKAGAWSSTSDGEVLLLDVEGNGSVTPDQVVLKKGQWDTYTATLTGSGSVRVSFEQFKGRFFLDEVLVRDPAATGLTRMSRQPLADGPYYTLDGRRLSGKPTAKGLYIVNGRKVAL